MPPRDNINSIGGQRQPGSDMQSGISNVWNIVNERLRGFGLSDFQNSNRGAGAPQQPAVNPFHRDPSHYQAQGHSSQSPSPARNRGPFSGVGQKLGSN
ncbi:unnamed protein product [Caenorhabditis auriculariae]|uniref:Uncharacterized protein n=1 Tax=Caenorhabditis auriculariae TaxID=2777116 RepID=A0A8S1HG66_9PELO|nr:unnamed protein product [Caenorhabditis auriculariae]